MIARPRSEHCICHAALCITLVLTVLVPGLEAADRIPSKPADKRLFFTVRNKPWDDVFEWLTDATGLPVCGHGVPGSLTYIAPKGRTYSLPEVIDIINEGLAGQKLILVRRPHSFIMVAADPQVDRALLPSVNIAELNQHGNSEMVRVEVALRHLAAKDFPVNKKLLGPFGSAAPIPGTNRLVLIDTVANSKRVLKVIRDREAEPPRTSYVCHRCKFSQAKHTCEIRVRSLQCARIAEFLSMNP